MADTIDLDSTSSEPSDNDIPPSSLSTPSPRTSRQKGKRKAGEKVEWSEDDDKVDLSVYEAFKNRASIKRQKTAEVKKKIARRAKDAVVGRRAPIQTESSKVHRDYGDDTEDELLEDALPDYLKARRKEFDKKANGNRLRKADLKLPPDYADIDFSDDERLESLHERPDFSKTIIASRPYKDIKLMHSGGVIPAPVAQYLRDYQVDGVAFLHELFVYQKGGILGDDMGLGKTVQVAAFLDAAFGKTGDERDFKRMRKMRRAADDRWYPRVLIVCPGTLIENWKQELERWGYWHVDVFHGTGREEVFRAAQSGMLEIMITTYATYKINKSQINLVPWDCVVADECHILKERTSETTKSMNEVNSLCRIGLTGTAIQNKYEELWTLLNWTNPGRFGPMSTWKSSIVTPLTMGQSHDATIQQLAIARKTAKKLAENLLPQFFLRRMKQLIAHQLPKKSDRVVFCPLTELQQEAYEQFLDSEVVEMVKLSGEKCDCGSKKKRGWCCYATINGTKWQALVFPVISNLQKLSNHLALLIPASSDAQDKQSRDLDFLQTMVPDRWEDLYNNRNSLHNLSNPEFCGKWRVLKKLLRFWHANGDKVLVFSHSVKLLKMLQHLFHNTSYNVSFLDGSLSYPERQAVVDDFNSSPSQFVFLISTKAGGVGLNITSANKVVIFDPNWNPSYDLQAQDRAYRIGQTRDVEVFRLVSAGTVEEIVYARQIYKQQQANIGYNASLERRYFKGVQNQKGQKGEIFGLQNLLSFHQDEVVLRDIVNKTNVAEAKAGVGLLDVDMDAAADEDDLFGDAPPDDGDAALSQLVDRIIEDAAGPEAVPKKGKKKQGKVKGDAISAILASAGVEYTHENSEVIGSSRVEAKLSRRAEAANLDAGGEAQHRLFDDESSQAVLSTSLSEGDDGTRKIRYQFRPPREVMRRQFCTMATMWGFESPVEFGAIVESWTTEQRVNALERFYKERREMLEEKDKQKKLEERRLEIEVIRRKKAVEDAAKEKVDGKQDETMADAAPDGEVECRVESSAIHANPPAQLVETSDDDDDELSSLRTSYEEI